MKKITTYFILFFLIFCTACSSDDTSKEPYPKIAEEDKALLVGDWQLMNYVNLQGDAVDLKKEGTLIYYHFASVGILEIHNVSSKPIEFTFNSKNLTRTRTLNYMYANIESKDEKEKRGEKLYFYEERLAFDMWVSQDQLIIKEIGGETWTFKRSIKGDNVEYSAISQHQKSLLHSNKWKLETIYAFNGEMRSFDQEEEVIYHFLMTKA